MEPLIVYLDSSDYSNLSGPRANPGGDLFGIKSYLKNEILSKRVEVRYSALHLMEAVHLDPRSKDMALARATLIEELSGTKVMRDFNEVATAEVQAITKEEATAVCATDDSGRWYPEFDPDLGKRFKADLQAMFSEDARSNLAKAKSRNERRILVKLFGTPEKASERFLLSLGGDKKLMARMARKHGVSPDLITRQLGSNWLHPDFPSERYDQVFREEMTRPIRMIDPYPWDTTGDPQWLGQPIRTLGQKTVRVVQEFRDRLSELKLSGDQQRELVRQFRNQSQAQLLEDHAALRRTLLRKVIGDDSTVLSDGQKSALSSPIGSMPAVDFMARAVVSLRSESLNSGLRSRLPLESDAADLEHMFYIPYVDVWRGDRFSSALASRVDPLQAQKIVSRLVDLPEKIDCRLRERQNRSV